MDANFRYKIDRGHWRGPVVMQDIDNILYWDSPIYKACWVAYSGEYGMRAPYDLKHMGQTALQPTKATLVDISEESVITVNIRGMEVQAQDMTFVQNRKGETVTTGRWASAPQVIQQLQQYAGDGVALGAPQPPAPPQFQWAPIPVPRRRNP